MAWQLGVLVAALCAEAVSGWSPVPAQQHLSGRPAVRRSGAVCRKSAGDEPPAVSRRGALHTALLWSLATGAARAAGAAVVEDGDVQKALEINAAEQARRAAALNEIEKKAAATKDAYESQLEGEAEAFSKSDLGRLLKKRTEENVAKNEASIREKYCIRDCKGLKPLAREPRTPKEFYCEECALEFGVIPGSEQYLKKSEQVAGGDGATAREEARKMQEERKKAEKGSGIKLKAFKDRGVDYEGAAAAKGSGIPDFTNSPVGKILQKMNKDKTPGGDSVEYAQTTRYGHCRHSHHRHSDHRHSHHRHDPTRARRYCAYTSAYQRGTFSLPSVSVRA